jgi:predicted  nucleic acid-binding Zn-ribbon protein
MVTENDLDKLRTLQEILSEKIIVERGIEEIPKMLNTTEDTLINHKKKFIEENQEYEKVKSAELELRELLVSAETAREKAERTISEISTQREFEALDKERHTAEEKEQQYRKELQQKERKLSELDNAIKQQTALIEQTENDLAAGRKSIEKDLAEKRRQLEDLIKKEQEITAGIDSEVAFKFERIIRNKMGLGIVAIKRNVCQGCHMILPAQFANNVRLGEEFVFCPYCSRILYYEESADGEEEFFDTSESGALSDLDDIDEDEYDEDDEDDEKVNIDYEE